MSQSATFPEGYHPIILVVYENPIILEIIRYILEFDGYEPALARDVPSALAWIDNANYEGRRPDLLILGLFTLLRSGVDTANFLEQLNQRWDLSQPLPPVVVLTTNSTDPTDPKELNADRIVILPFTPVQLSRAVKDLLS